MYEVSSDNYALLLGKMHRLGFLADQDREAIRGIPLRIGRLDALSTIVREGDKITECCLLLHGYACRHKLAVDGGRQIVSFHVAGDILDIQHLWFDRADHNIETVTDAVLAFFPTESLREVSYKHPAIATSLWRDSLVDASIFREWVLNIGRRDAKTRIAHMLCEFVAKCEAAGLGTPDAFRLPMTQEQIGDATGLTSVHVNRMLRELREEGFIARENRNYRIADWPKLKRLAGFSDDYLHMAA